MVTCYETSRTKKYVNIKTLLVSFFLLGKGTKIHFMVKNKENLKLSIDKVKV